MTNKFMTSPVGIASFPRVSGEPDTKFKQEGEYHVKLILDPENNEKDAAFIDSIKALYEKGLAEAKATAKKPKVKQVPLSISDDTDADGNPTGKVRVKFTMKANVTKKDGTTFSQRPALFDAKGNPLKKVNVGGGSKVRVAFEPRSFYNSGLGYGLTLALRGVQILELVEYGSGASAEYMGFKAEDGYEFTPSEDSGDEDVDSQPKGSAPASEDGDY